MKKCIGKALIADDTTDGGGRATQETKPRMVVPLLKSIRTICSCIVPLPHVPVGQRSIKLALWELTRAAIIAQNLFDVRLHGCRR